MMKRNKPLRRLPAAPLVALALVMLLRSCPSSAVRAEDGAADTEATETTAATAPNG